MCLHLYIRIKSHEWMHNLSFHLTFNCMKRYKSSSTQTTLKSYTYILKEKARQWNGAGWVRNFKSLYVCDNPWVLQKSCKNKTCEERIMFVWSMNMFPAHIVHTHPITWNVTNDNTFIGIHFLCVLGCSCFKIYWIESAYCVIFWEWMWENARFWLCDMKPMLTKWK